MRTVLSIAILVSGISAASAQYLGQPYGNSFGGNGLYGTGSNPNSHYVTPYTRNDGTSVGGHYQTNPNTTQFDNFGTRGNYNPYSGQFGTRSPRW